MRPRSCARSSASRSGSRKAKLRTRCDNKMETVRIGNKAGVASVPNALAKVGTYAELRKITEKAGIGHDLVIQTAFGDSRPHHLLHLQRGRVQPSRQGDRQRSRSEDHEAHQVPRRDHGGLRHALRHAGRPAADRSRGPQGADALQGRLVRQRGVPRRLHRAGTQQGARHGVRVRRPAGEGRLSRLFRPRLPDRREGRRRSIWASSTRASAAPAP